MVLFTTCCRPLDVTAWTFAPRHSGVIEDDWLLSVYRPPVPSPQCVVIGNPPFGKRGKLAVAFLNKGFLLADTVAFIVPAIFRKYSIHRQLVPAARLIAARPLPPNAFRTDDHPDYSVRTEFQLWTMNQTLGNDQRLTTPPPISHPDFELRQYNNTPAAEKVFSAPFDFAVPCQGYQDYSRKETDAWACERHKQWMLFKAFTQAAKEQLIAIDFASLAEENITVTPGFRKNDVVQKYMQRHAGRVDSIRYNHAIRSQ